MKTLKVYDHAHTAVKVAAAQTGRTTTNIASSILLYHFQRIADGSLTMGELLASDSEVETEEDSES
jgi:hypothetical protein